MKDWAPTLVVAGFDPGLLVISFELETEESKKSDIRKERHKKKLCCQR